MPLPFGFGTLQIGMWNRQAQRLIFKYTHQGDLSCFLSAYFDPKSAQDLTPVEWWDLLFIDWVPNQKAFPSRFLQHSQPQPSSLKDSQASKQEAKAYAEIALSLGIEATEGSETAPISFMVEESEVQQKFYWKKGPAVCWKPGER